MSDESPKPPTGRRTQRAGAPSREARPWLSPDGRGLSRPAVTVSAGVGGSARYRGDDWHILTVAESGFSMLDIYGRGERGLSLDVIREFAHKVNRTDEPDTLFPQAPISALPRRFFREQATSRDPEVTREFMRQIIHFLVANRRVIRAPRLFVNFHVCNDPVPAHYIRIAEEIFRHIGPHTLIKEAVILP